MKQLTDVNGSRSGNNMAKLLPRREISNFDQIKTYHQPNRPPQGPVDFLMKFSIKP